MKKGLFLKLSAAVIMAAFLVIVPYGAVSQTNAELVVGTVFNDTDVSPTMYGPVVLDIVVDRHFVGRGEPGKSMEVALERRADPYDVRAYAFDYEGSAFFASVDLPLTYTVVVPISHRGKLSSCWVAFEGIR